MRRVEYKMYLEKSKRNKTKKEDDKNVNRCCLNPGPERPEKFGQLERRRDSHLWCWMRLASDCGAAADEEGG